MLCPAPGYQQHALKGHRLPRSAYDCVVPAHGKEIVKTDLAIHVPPGTYGRVAPRSGLAVKNFIDTGAGVIDEDYRGNVGVVLFNHSSVDFVGEPFSGAAAPRFATLPAAEAGPTLAISQPGCGVACQLVVRRCAEPCCFACRHPLQSSAATAWRSWCWSVLPRPMWWRWRSWTTPPGGPAAMAPPASLPPSRSEGRCRLVGEGN